MLCFLHCDSLQQKQFILGTDRWHQLKRRRITSIWISTQSICKEKKRLYYLRCPLTVCQHGFSTDTHYICHQQIWFPRYHVCKSHKGARVVYPRPSHWPTFCDTFMMLYLMQQFLITPWVIAENLQRLWNEHQYWSTWPLVPSTMAISHNKEIKFTPVKTAGWVMLLQWVILKCKKE